MTLPDQSARTYRDGWLLRGRQLNEIYDALTSVVGRSPNGDPVEDIKALGAELDRLREQVARAQRPFEPCACVRFCGDSDPDGPGTCKSLPREPEPPLVRIVAVPRSSRASDERQASRG